MKNLLTSLLLLSFLVPQFAIAKEGQTGKKTIGIDFFTKVKMISNLQEKEGQIFFIVAQASMENNNYSRDLYQLIDGEAIRLTSSGNVSDFYLLENTLIFKNARDEKDRERIRKGEPLTVFQQLNSGYQEATEWLRLPYQVGSLVFVDNNRFFFTATYDHAFEKLLKENNGNMQEALKKKEEEKAFRIFDELPFWSNGRGDVNGLRSHLYYYDNGDIKKITSNEYETVSSLELSKDKKTLIYTQREYESKGPQGNNLISLDVTTFIKKEWPLFDKANYGGVAFINDQEIILTINRGLERDRNENSGFYRLNLTNGNISEIYNGDIYGMGNSIGSDIKTAGRAPITVDKEGIRYVSTVVDQAPLIHVGFKNAEVKFLTKDPICVLEYVPYKDGYLLNAMVAQEANEIYFLDKNGKLNPLSSLNKQLFDEHQVIAPVEVKFTNEKGQELNGYVLPPANYQKDKKYPAILDIHGGPKTAYGTVFFHEMQYWANEGYAVIFTNPTGSDGRGTEFADLRGKYGSIDYNDIMAFVDATLQQVDYIDESRIGVTGGSYGGFMTNWIIGHTNRFKAAASQRSIASWLSFSTTSDIGYTFIHSQIGTDAWTNNDLLWDQSPLKYADKVKTPTLFIHSEEDYRCWLVEGVQMYYALKYFDIPSRLVVFNKENHELSRSGRPLNRIKRLSEITEWFDSYLK